MDEAQFWDIIQRSQVTVTVGGEDEQQCKNLAKILSSLPETDIAAFDRRFTQLFAYANRWTLINAINYLDHVSDDSFMDFRYWLISQGHDHFYSACANPDAFLARYVGSNEFLFFQDFGAVAEDLLPDDSTHIDDLIPIGNPSTEGMPDDPTDENLPERYPLMTLAMEKLNGDNGT